jgi:hypothetical protein
VDHQGGVDTGERAAPGQLDLSSAALFGRGAEHHEAAETVASERRRREAGAQAGGRDHVVPARMADLRERIVLAEHRHHRTLTAHRGPERRRHAVGRAFGRQRGLVEHRGQEIVRGLLLVGQLRVIVDPVGDVDETVTPPVDLRAHGCLELVDLHAPAR